MLSRTGFTVSLNVMLNKLLFHGVGDISDDEMEYNAADSDDGELDTQDSGKSDQDTIGGTT